MSFGEVVRAVLGTGSAIVVVTLAVPGCQERRLSHEEPASTGRVQPPAPAAPSVRAAPSVASAPVARPALPPTPSASAVLPLVDPDCSSPWVALELFRSNSGTGGAVSRVRQLLCGLPGVTECSDGSATLASDVCLLRVYFYGGKSFVRDEVNRDAIAVRCASRDLCDKIANQYAAAHHTVQQPVRCTGAIPTSGAVHPLPFQCPD